MTVKKYITIVFVTALCLGQIACKKDKMLSYDFGSGIVIYKNGIAQGRDSLTVSFAIKNEAVQYDTVELPLRIVGSVSTKDREVKVSAISGLTTAPVANYEILPVMIPANSYEGLLKIKVNKTNDMKTKEVKIWLTLTDSDEFKVGPKEQSTYLIKVNDYLTKPSSWDNIRFGEFSQAKYGLIIRETGYSDFTGLLPEVLVFIATKCRNFLNQYFEINEKEYLDENEFPVRFP